MKRAKRGALSLALLLVLGLLAVAPIVQGALRPAGAVSPDFSITTTPALVPAFNPAIQNYAIRCTGSPTTQVTTVGTGPVTVGATTFPGPVTLNLPLVAGQDVQITNGGTSYYIRCLPSDFPAYTASVTGQPQQANGYMLTLTPYIVVFDTDGVPVWWYKYVDPFAPFDAKFINNSTIAFSDGFQSAYHFLALNGTQQPALGGAKVPLDFHDLQLLPNGNYLAIMDVTRNCPADPTQCVDLSSWGSSYSSQSTILDDQIVEVTPSNQIVWSWSVADHINVAAANVNWHDQFPDVIHMNSILYDGNGGIIFSARHLDAVYRIDMATGALTWKLGGSQEPESLNVVGDQYVNSGGQLFSGQHYARIAPNGQLTVHDNGTRANRAPRALAFNIDTSTNTATEEQQITDSRITFAACCGSAEMLAGGDWVMSWGDNDEMTELNPQGVPQITITYPGLFSYRESGVPVTVDALRQGMDAQVAPLTDVPSTTIGVPTTSGSTLSGGQWLDAGAADPVGVSNVVFDLSGGTFNHTPIATGSDSIVGWLAGWDTTTVPNGTYTLQSVATNAAGASTYSTPVTVFVANPPTTRVSVPAPGSQLSGGQWLDASATDALGVTKVVFELTGGSLNDTPIATAELTIVGWLAGWDTTTVPNGTYTLQSVATNAVNLSSTSPGITVTVANPTITSISPTSGPGGGGTKVTITGSKLTGATKVMFGTVSATSFSVNSATKIVAYAPAETAGTVDVTATVGGVTTAPVTGDRYSFLAPTISKIGPTKGPVAGGTAVTITGTNLTGAAQVEFGSIAATYTVTSATKITAYAPAEAAGTVAVVVTTPGGTTPPDSADNFTYR